MEAQLRASLKSLNMISAVISGGLQGEFHDAGRRQIYRVALRLTAVKIWDAVTFFCYRVFYYLINLPRTLLRKVIRHCV